MEALKTKGVAHKGILSVPVPKEFEERELEIIVLSSNQKQNDLAEEEERCKHEEKVKRLMSIVGSAKFPNFPITKYDAYDQ